MIDSVKHIGPKKFCDTGTEPGVCSTCLLMQQFILKCCKPLGLSMSVTLIARKYYIRMKMVNPVKHMSLLGCLIQYIPRKKYVRGPSPGGSIIKILMALIYFVV